MLDFSRFRFISFDCYGTLIDWEAGILSALRPELQKHSIDLPDADLLQIYGELEAEAEAGEYKPYRDVLRDVAVGLAKRLGFVATPTEQNSLPDSVSSWRPFPDTVNALRDLSSKFKLAIISNIDDDLFAASARQLETNFDHVITAFQARAYKPSPTIFRLAQERLGISTQEWLHAGQSIYHDVVPARSLGIATAWVNRPSKRPGLGAVRPAASVPDLEVTSLSQLADLSHHFPDCGTEYESLYSGTTDNSVQPLKRK
jgi:2-haloacid dehalogenase